MPEWDDVLISGDLIESRRTLLRVSSMIRCAEVRVWEGPECPWTDATRAEVARGQADFTVDYFSLTYHPLRDGYCEGCPGTHTWIAYADCGLCLACLLRASGYRAYQWMTAEVPVWLFATSHTKAQLRRMGYPINGLGLTGTWMDAPLVAPEQIGLPLGYVIEL